MQFCTGHAAPAESFAAFKCNAFAQWQALLLCFESESDRLSGVATAMSASAVQQLATLPQFKKRSLATVSLILTDVFALELALLLGCIVRHFFIRSSRSH